MGVLGGYATGLRRKSANFAVKTNNRTIMELVNSLIFMLGAMAPYILLGFLIAGLMHAFVPRRAMSRHLSGTGLMPVVKAALVGVPLPLCSCGVLPTAIAMRRGGASRAASTSFLLATPQTGVDSIAATWSLLGPAFALVRPVAALITAVAGGWAVGRGEKEADTACTSSCATDAEELPEGFAGKCAAAMRYGFVDLVGSIGGWLVAGLLIAAAITVWVPADAFAALGENPLLAMLAVLVIAVPMYVCATGSIPIAMSLMLKGLSPGTALVLLMAGPAVNFASYALVSREMGRRAALTYLASITAGAILFGLAIDYLMPASWFDLSRHVHAAHAHGVTAFEGICAALLALLLVAALIRNYLNNNKHIENMTRTYTVKGMNCPHCQAAVKKSIAAVSGVEKVEVDLASGKAHVEGTPADADIVAAVRAAGFDIA